MNIKLTSNDALSLIRKVLGTDPPKALTFLLPPNRPALVEFARLVANHTNVHAVIPEASSIESSTAFHVISLPEKTDANRFAAWHAIRSGHHHVFLPDTLYDNALTSLSTRVGAHPTTSSIARGCEMLPEGTLTFSRPLLDVSPDVLGETNLESLGTDLVRAADHGARKHDACNDLNRASEALLRASICDASHWGYVVLRRSVLAEEYNQNSQLVARDAIARVMAHCSGGAAQIPSTGEHVARIAECVLARKHDTRSLPPIPKGRTAGGMVIRRATGRFARKVGYADARRRRLRRPNNDDADDLMIITREPDHESSGLRARRLGGNLSCAPLSEKGSVYWDNRYVMMTQSTDEKGIMLDDVEIMEAALRPSESLEMKDASLYVRQLRKVDWERITAATERVRAFQVPYECIRALPGVFEKVAGNLKCGNLTASPHLGLTARADLLFTAVRVPRYRTLPKGICPGFVGRLEREQRAEAEKRRNRARVQRA